MHIQPGFKSGVRSEFVLSFARMMSMEHTKLQVVLGLLRQGLKHENKAKKKGHRR
jgi:hypothetical protein